MTGGVSSWINTLIRGMTEHEFIIYTIGAFEKSRGKYKYELPSNVISIEEIFLDSIYSIENKSKFKNIAMSDELAYLIKQLILGNEFDWELFIILIRELEMENVMELFMSKQFFEILKEICTEFYTHLPFTDFFWSMRSMLLPILYLVRQEVPYADLYHSVSAGYGGIIGGIGKCLYSKPYLLTEHGIYAREREEEIIKSDWVKGHFKDEWIKFFYNLARCSYNLTSKVATLFGDNRRVEIDLGCDANKIEIIPNGVDIGRFKNEFPEEERDYINIGAVVRVVPIKDIKTMLSAFSLLKEKIDKVNLYIIGPIDEDEDYYEECLEMVNYLKIKDVYFTGTVNISEYLGKMDILLLSSVSEGQPLAILEGMACGKPFVATNVGSCKELLYGREDQYGDAGIIVPVMDYDKMAQGLYLLCNNEKLRREMGENGYRRVNEYYTLKNFIDSYKYLYNTLMNQGEI